MGKESQQPNIEDDPVAQGAVDLLLDARQLKVEEIKLGLANLLSLELKNLEAELLLKADLEEVVTVLRHLVSTLEERPELLERLLNTLAFTVEEAAEVAADGAGYSGNGADRRGIKEREVTDAAAKKAGELGVDLSCVAGTGQNGRVLVGDVEEAAAEAG